VDNVDLKIVEILRSRPRATNRTIAQLLGLTEMATGKRVRRLFERGDIRLVGKSNPLALGYKLTAHVDVYAQSGQIENVARLLAAGPSIDVVEIVAGPPHIMLVFQARTSAELMSILEREVIGIEGVDRTEVHLSAETIKMHGEEDLA
jgi:DNA-binding Lrp family transcriptional regulator